MHFSKFSLTFYKNEEKIHENSYKNISSDNNIFRFNLYNYDTILDIEKEIFTRENAEFLFKLDIKNDKCIIYLKKEDLTIDVLVDYSDLIILDNKIILEYSIESDDAKNKVIIEKSDENE